MEAKSNVFEDGNLSVQLITVNAGQGASSPPKPLLLVSPVEAGEYPVVLFLHGFLLHNHNYTKLLQHIASHGFILVAPQLYTQLILELVLPDDMEDITGAANTTNWLAGGNLQPFLPTDVKPNLLKLALAGHSRGGHAAFSLALGHAAQTTVLLKFRALVGVDPVAGRSKSNQVPPLILTYEPSSFDLQIPVLVIGTGLGDQKKYGVLPACAPDGVNHNEFYYECRPPCYHVVVSEFGHVDVLDNVAAEVFGCACQEGDGRCRDVMRKSVSGVVVAFLRNYFDDDDDDVEFKAILDHPEMAPTKLDPVAYRDDRRGIQSIN